MKRQKDEDAGSTKKHGKSHYGYKDHTRIGKKPTLIIPTSRFRWVLSIAHNSEKLWSWLKYSLVVEYV